MPKEQKPIYLKILPDERHMLLDLVDKKITERNQYMATLRRNNDFMHEMLAGGHRKETESWQNIRKELQRAVSKRRVS